MTSRYLDLTLILGGAIGNVVDRVLHGYVVDFFDFHWGFLAGKTQEEVEKNHIRVTLEMTEGNRVKAALAMGISERTLYRKIKDYGL